MKKKQKAYEYVSVGMQIRTGDMIQLLKVFPAFAGHKFSWQHQYQVAHDCQ